MENTTERVVGRVLHINTHNTTTRAPALFRALASPQRLRILAFLSDRLANISEIAQALDLPLSTTTMHVNVLEETRLITTELRSAVRGQQKVCARLYDTVVVDLPQRPAPVESVVELSLPIGHFMDCRVTPTCGLCSETGVIGELDDPSAFYLPERIHAQLLWFTTGYVEYRFANPLPKDAHVESLQFSVELCSEAPLHHADWPSDITLWINGQEVGTWTSPADFGGERGRFTPDWWQTWNTQYGLLKLWQVAEEGSFVDDIRVSDVTVEDLALCRRPYISVKIGVKETAEHPGGLNLFGSRFGNHPQDLLLRLRLHGQDMSYSKGAVGATPIP